MISELCWILTLSVQCIGRICDWCDVWKFRYIRMMCSPWGWDRATTYTHLLGCLPMMYISVSFIPFYN